MNCKNCRQNCAWAGKERSEHGKCFVGYIPTTNADLIRSMTDEELAEVIADGFCSTRSDKCNNFKRCIDCTLDWLKQEAE